jgi:hypothetical protein
VIEMAPILIAALCHDMGHVSYFYGGMWLVKGKGW